MPTTPTVAGWARLAGLTYPIAPGPLRLDGQHAAYLVVDGEADLFLVRYGTSEVRSRRHFVARVPQNSMVPSPPVTGGWQLMIVPLPGTHLRSLADDAYAQIVEAAGAGPNPSEPGPDRSAWTMSARAMVLALERALLHVADSMRVGQAPRDALPMRPHQIISLAAGSALTGTSGVWWLRMIGGDMVRNDFPADAMSSDGELLLLAGRDWITATAACTIESMSSWELFQGDLLWSTVRQHFDRLIRVIEVRMAADDERFVETLRRRKKTNAAVVASAARLAYGVVGTSRRRAPAAEMSHLDLYQRTAAVLRLLTADTHVRVVEPADRTRKPADEKDALRSVARSSGLHIRSVRLPPGWWHRDIGPLIGWRKPEGADPEASTTVDESTAYALVLRRGRYHMIDPQTRAFVPITAESAEDFGYAAMQVQLPLSPTDGLKGLVRSGMRGGRRDVVGLLVTALVVAVLGLAVPLVSGDVLGSIASSGSASTLVQLALMLIASAVVAALIGIAQNIRLLRVEGRLEIGAQLAIWDRLMRLPARFFSRTSSGELANAMLGITFVRESLSGLMAQAVSAAVTIVADLVLMLVINVEIGIVALVVLLVVAGLTVMTGRTVAGHQRRALPAEHRSASRTNQLLGGITKIKLAAAEDRAYNWWAESNVAARAELQKVRRVQANLTAVAGAIPLAGQLVLFGLLAGPLFGKVTTAGFFVVNVAFAVLLGAMLVVVTATVEIVAAIPRLSNLREILDAKPEHNPDRTDPGEIRGEIALHNVTFGYNPDEPPILDDVSFEVQPGEFVAIVGPSGCGKSTLLRLLLGFEQPRSGSVLYDGQDLGELDLQAIRRQCGVVLQDGTLFAGTLRENVCGAANFPMEEVWQAIRMAGLEEDVDALPMGLGTMLPFGGGTLSVGQRQRVLIARALIHRPRVLFFDEATSALDNRTQETVTASTRELAASRIIIAHRLTTVMDADLILVLDRGRVVQRGTYQSLMLDRNGLFHRLASRQLLAATTADGAEPVDETAAAGRIPTQVGDAVGADS